MLKPHKDPERESHSKFGRNDEVSGGIREERQGLIEKKGLMNVAKHIFTDDAEIHRGGRQSDEQEQREAKAQRKM